MTHRFASLATAIVALFTVTATQAQQATPTPVMTPSPVRVAASAPLALPTAALREFHGDYQLSDGNTLSVALRGRQLYASLPGQERVPLVATSDNRFVSASGATELVFRQARNGNVWGVELRLPGGLLAVAPAPDQAASL